MYPKLLLIFLVIIFSASHAQNANNIQILEQKISNAKNDGDKIDALCQLAEYFSIFRLDKKTDSLLQKALIVAELSNDSSLVLKTLFNNTVTKINPWNSKETFERTTDFIQKGLAYAQQINNEQYIAIAYIRLADIYRKRGEYDEAVKQVNQAFTALENSDADSIICLLYNEQGDIYLAKGDAVPACKNYNNAFGIAY